MGTISLTKGIASRPVPTTLYEKASGFVPENNSAYIYGKNQEERSEHLACWPEQNSVNLVQIVSHTDTIIITVDLDELTVPLYSARHVEAVWTQIKNAVIYIDITALPHHVWAPLLNSALSTGRIVRVVYVEPSEYKRSREPYQFYDLSDGIGGIKQLPGFISLSPTHRPFTFVPLLGFEDARFSNILNQVYPQTGKSYPVIGVPGFRPEYPFETYRSNARTLGEEGSELWMRVRFADAGCPFRLFYLLDEIAEANPEDVIKIALLGTKPHALGAVLFSLSRRRGKVELIYDNPIPRVGRTKGTGRLFVYHVSSFLPPLLLPMNALPQVRPR